MSSRPRRHPLALKLTARLLPPDTREEILGDLIEHWSHLVKERTWFSRTTWAWRQPFVALLARLRFGATGTRHNVRRERRWGVGISALDLKLGARMLIKYPGLTLVGTVALAVTIATVVGVHAFTGNVVGRNLPVPEGDRVVGVWNVDVRTGRRAGQTLGDMLMWRTEMRTLRDVGAFAIHERVISSTEARGRPARAARITASAFAMLRVPPYLGRPLVADDERPGAAPVAVIGFDLWQAEFGSDTTIAGKTIRIGGAPHTVVGVMPSGFGFPVNEQIWTPFATPASDLTPGVGPPINFAVGRLAPGVTLQEAEAELQALGSRLAIAYPQTHEYLGPQINTYARSFIDADDPTLASFMQLLRTAIVTVLLVAAVNVGTLVYARTAARVREVTVRKALGASRRRIVMQFFAEALVLASLAGVIGIGIATWAVRKVMHILTVNEEGLPYWWDASMGMTTLVVAVGLVLLSAVLTGVVPALAVTGRRVGSSIQRVAGGASLLNFGRAATAVVVIQVAISIGCLSLGGMALGTFLEDYAMNDGVAREEYVAAEVVLDRNPDEFDAPERRAASFARQAEIRRELSRRVSGHPDVLGVTFGTRLPGMEHPVLSYELEGAQTGDPYGGRARIAWVEPGYFGVFGLTHRAGQPFTNRDVAGEHARVAVVNEAFVRWVLGLEQAVGRRIRLTQPGDSAAGPWAEIVGVVPDVTVDMGSAAGGWPAIYFPLVSSARPLHMAVHVSDDPSQFIGQLRAIGNEVNPLLVLRRAEVLDALVRSPAMIMHLFGVGVGILIFAALALSTAGVYSLMSFTVAQRTREIGIRTALGAHPRRVVSDVFSRAILQLLMGTALGLLPLVGTGQLLFKHGPWSAIGITIVMLMMGLIACGDPVLRALRIQPTDALREDG